MKKYVWIDDEESLDASRWFIVVSLILSLGCFALIILVHNDLDIMVGSNDILRRELPIGKLIIFLIVSAISGIFAVANAAIFYVNIKGSFNAIYNSLFKKQTYKFRK